MEGTVKFHLVGTKRLLMNNGMQANPMDPLTREIQAIAKKRNKTDADLSQLALLEGRATMYRTTDGFLGIPLCNLWKCLFNAGKSFKLGADIERALEYSTDVWPLYLDGEKVIADESYFLTHPERLDYRPVVRMGRRSMKARVIVPVGWEWDAEMAINTDVLQVNKLVPALARAGMVEGLCDWRPIWGTFKGTIVE